MDDYVERRRLPENALREIEDNIRTTLTRTHTGRQRTVGSRRLPVRGTSILPLIIVLLMAGAGCSTSNQKAPLRDSTMVDLLIELHLAAARGETTHESPSNIRDSILTAYNVDSATYAQAVTFYAERPEKYAEIYSRVLDRLHSERMPLRGDPSDEHPADSPPARSVR